MKVVIVGCGRVGSTLAENLDATGHEVIIFDVRTAAFDRLPETFKGAAIRGDGTDAEVLRRGGAEGADFFLSLTEGDNRNVMAAQVATESFGIPQVIAKINDPVRAAADQATDHRHAQGEAGPDAGAEGGAETPAVRTQRPGFRRWRG